MKKVKRNKKNNQEAGRCEKEVFNNKIRRVSGYMSRDEMTARDELPKIPVHSIAFDDAQQLLPYVHH